MNIQKSFYNIFQIQSDDVYFSPGRVNIIGEHIDYNGGYVLPAAISLGTYAAIRLRDDQTIRLFSDNFSEDGIIKCFIKELSYKDEDHWANYIKGVIAFFNDGKHKVTHGFDLYIKGTLPPQSGLSSSASLLVLIVYIMNDLYNFELSTTEMALIAQHVENNYMGMHCGIMDQLVIAKGIKNKALLMNTKTYETIPVNAFFKGFSWVIMNTNYQRKTTESKYNERVKECQEALKIINTYKSVHFLCDLSIHDFNRIKKHIKNDTLIKRAKHAITEQQRVITAEKAMKDQDFKLFASLMNDSHTSLKNDYEVTGKHLDALVDSAIKHGAIGARVTGAGFGGCAIALVSNDLLSHFDQLTSKAYKDITGLDASFYHVSFVDGTRKIEELS